jgi:hypothetical protein
MRRKKSYKDIRSMELFLHQPGDKKFTQAFVFANTIEQAVAELQEMHPEKNYVMANVMTHRFIPNDELVSYLKKEWLPQLKAEAQTTHSTP